MDRAEPHRLLHIISESTWRGGENQVRMLLEQTQNQDWQWHLAAPPESEALQRMAHLAHTLPVPMRGARILSAAWTLARYARRHDIQLIDCQSARAHNLGLMIKRLCPSIQLVVHRRVDYPPAPGYWHHRKYMSPLVDRYICISDAIRQVLARYGVPPERLVTVRSAVNGQAFASVNRAASRAKLRAEWGLAPSIPVIGNLAYITEQKDHATLIRSLARVRDAGLPFFAFIAGDGPLRPAAERLAAELNLGPTHLRFLGVRKDVAELLATADIFALSSQDEGLGTSLLDAIHSGCALVATAVGGIPEIVVHEHSGLTSPAHDAEAFARNLCRLLQHPQDAIRLRREAGEHLARNFSLASMVEGNLNVYRQLLC